MYADVRNPGDADHYEGHRGGGGHSFHGHSHGAGLDDLFGGSLFSDLFGADGGGYVATLSPPLIHFVFLLTREY